MKTLASLLLISATFVGTSAYAASPNLEPNNVPFQGVYGQVDANAPTRAQIVAELQTATAAGQVSSGDLDYPPVAARADSVLTRGQVHAEVLAIRKNGPVAFGGQGYPNTGA